MQLTYDQHNKGFSLAEVMVAMVIFAFAALALSKAVMHTRKLSENSIYYSTAHGVAYGYAEQLMAMDYGDILSSLSDPDNIPLTMKAVSPSAASSSVEVDDQLYLNSTNNKNIVIDIRDSSGNEKTIEMPMRFIITATNLDTGSNPYKSVEVKMEFHYKSPSRRGNDRWVEETIHFVKSAVPIY